MKARQLLAGLDEPIHRQLGRVDDGRAQVTIDTGYGLAPLGPDADEDWRDDFELGDDGSFDLYVWDGRIKRAVLNARVIDGREACSLLAHYGALSPDDCEVGDENVLSIDYTRVDPKFRGYGYAARLVAAAVETFARRGWWVYGDCFSQLIYTNLRRVLPPPVVAVPATHAGYDDDPIYSPSDQAILANLDATPVESAGSYRGGFRLANERHVHVLWRL